MSGNEKLGEDKEPFEAKKEEYESRFADPDTFSPTIAKQVEQE